MTIVPGPLALQSPFDIGGANPTIEVLRGSAALRRQRETLPLDEARVFLNSQPSWEIEIEGSAATNDSVWMLRSLDGWPATEAVFSDRRAKGSLHPETVQLGGDFRSSPYTVSAQGALREMTIGRTRRLSSVLFHVPNFPDFLGSRITTGTAFWRGRLELRSGDWRLTLDARQDLADVKNQLRSEGGYAITHIGSLDKDGDIFDRDDALDVLNALHWFLSFVRGAWTSPLIYEGRGRRSVWRSLSAGRTDRWGGELKWCDYMGWQAAQEAYAGFMRLWGRSVWQQGLRVGIGQYISANKPDPLETAIIAAQSGLELLGWLQLVESKRVTAKAWKNQGQYPAAEKIRMLLNLSSVDLTIPPQLGSLIGLRRDWTDGPSVVAGVRNRLVHPRKANGSVGWPYEVLIDTWLILSRYLELALLYAMGVSSPIRDRLEENPLPGVTTVPPWAVP